MKIKQPLEQVLSKTLFNKFHNYLTYSFSTKNGVFPFTEIASFNKDLTESIVKNGKESTDICNHENIVEYKSRDLKDDYGQIMCISSKDITVQYAKQGYKPKSKDDVNRMLNNQITLPKNTLMCLLIPSHTLFKINLGSDYFIKYGNNITQNISYTDIDKQYSLNTLLPLGNLEADNIFRLISQTINKDPNKEYFFDEITSKQVLPNNNLPTSITYMEFKEQESSPTHYHPTGERMLFIINKNSQSGATLNFCGINEAPDACPETERKISFPQNTLSVLRFPAYTHHKFFGEFNCISIHPQEGKKLIEAIEQGGNQKGFLELATIISKKIDNQKNNSNNLIEDIISTEQLNKKNVNL